MLTFHYLGFPCHVDHQFDDRAYQSFHRCRHHLDVNVYGMNDVMHDLVDVRVHVRDVCDA